MKIYVDFENGAGNELVSEFGEFDLKLLKDVIQAEIIEDDIKRRLDYIISHRIETAQEEMHNRWKEVLNSRLDAIPTDKTKISELIFNQPDYLNRSERDRNETDGRE